MGGGHSSGGHSSAHASAAPGESVSSGHAETVSSSHVESEAAVSSSSHPEPTGRIVQQGHVTPIFPRTYWNTRWQSGEDDRDGCLKYLADTDVPEKGTGEMVAYTTCVDKHLEATHDGVLIGIVFGCIVLAFLIYACQSDRW